MQADIRLYCSIGLCLIAVVFPKVKHIVITQKKKKLNKRMKEKKEDILTRFDSQLLLLKQGVLE